MNPEETAQMLGAVKAMRFHLAKEIHQRLTGHPMPDLSAIITGPRAKERYGVIADVIAYLLAENEIRLRDMGNRLQRLEAILGALETPDAEAG